MFSLLCIGFLSCFLVGLFRKYAIKKDLLDHPNLRSSHLVPTPRGGGVVFPILLIIYILFLYFTNEFKPLYLYIFLPPVILISLVSFFDDTYQLAARWRFLAQLSAAVYSMVIIGGLQTINLGAFVIDFGWFGYIFIVLALLWSINLYNFMDGIDGLAAVEALFIFGFGGYFVWCAGGYVLANIIWSVAAMAAGFLWWNKPPAKIFMGDVGSTLLGFLVILLGLAGEVWYGVPFILWIILYGVFLFDATLTLIRRIMHGDVWYEAHRLHAYQRLQLQQWSHRKILCGIIVVNSMLAMLVLIGFYLPQYMLFLLMLAITILSICYLLVEKVQPMYLRR